MSDATVAITRRRMLISAGTALAWGPALAALSDFTGAQEKPEQPLIADRGAMLDALSRIIESSVARHDTKHPVFHGCYDWHSAVHGHWAILRSARVTGSFLNGQDRAITTALAPDKLQREADALRNSLDFEMPYGRAWFLRLAIEYEFWAEREDKPNVERLRPFGDQVAGSLAAYYRERKPSPATREYSNDSWTLAQLHGYLSRGRHADDLTLVEQLITEHFVRGESSVTFGQDRELPDFFSRFGNWAYLVAKTQDQATMASFLRRHPLTDDDLLPVDPLLRPAHHLGVNWSRAWALRALARACGDSREQQRFEGAYRRHVETAWRHHQKYTGNYVAYDHWVPQFAVYALTE